MKPEISVFGVERGILGTHKGVLGSCAKLDISELGVERE